MSGLRSRTRLAWFLAQRVRMYGCALIQCRLGERIAFVREKLRVLRGIVTARDLFRGDRREFHAIAVLEAHRAARHRYVPGPYHGPTVVYVTANRAVVDQIDHRLDWLGLVPQARPPQYVPGRDSGDMLSEPHVRVLAERVNAALAQVHARIPVGPESFPVAPLPTEFMERPVP